MRVASWSGWFGTALFRALRFSLTVCGGAFRYPIDIDFRSNPSLYLSTLRRVSMPDSRSEHVARWNATSSNKTPTLFSARFAFPIHLCVWISMIIQEMKSWRKSQNQQKCQCSRRPTASRRRSAAEFRRRLRCIIVKTTDFSRPKNKHKRLAIVNRRVVHANRVPDLSAV